MGLKMKNVNIMGVHQFLGEGEGGSQKTIYIGNFLKRSLENLQKAWQKIRRNVLFFFFVGGGIDTSMQTMT